MPYLLDQWIELESFENYRNWKTPKGFLCGTYASSVLLAYWYDQLDGRCLAPNSRVKNDPRSEKIVEQLQPWLQPIDLPTVSLQIAIGLNRFFRYYKIPYRARQTSLGSWQRVTKRILKGEPVMIGLMYLRGSTYKNHWVVVHGFMETSAGERFYKVHDNWGNSAAVIPAKWGNGTISLVSQNETAY
ncbi:hypothetical protein [Enterococcus hermanniensis]|uniref:Peptidase C39-like domain-containing protein n=1 Tax=Enterococcus hermanniensis TaxID=249189 RepID=A0A1L8TNL9_9ENTE|nr:hypothetical protein [Enterococcus hermanniensis]OJG45925.1 hypothetical protein RV04_GL001691 [Enterococcus hermanniensis]